LKAIFLLLFVNGLIMHKIEDAFYRIVELCVWSDVGFPFFFCPSRLCEETRIYYEPFTFILLKHFSLSGSFYPLLFFWLSLSLSIVFVINERCIIPAAVFLLTSPLHSCSFCYYSCFLYFYFVHFYCWSYGSSNNFVDMLILLRNKCSFFLVTKNILLAKIHFGHLLSSPSVHNCRQHNPRMKSFLRIYVLRIYEVYVFEGCL